MFVGERIDSIRLMYDIYTGHLAIYRHPCLQSKTYNIKFLTKASKRLENFYLKPIYVCSSLKISSLARQNDSYITLGCQELPLYYNELKKSFIE